MRMEALNDICAKDKTGNWEPGGKNIAPPNLLFEKKICLFEKLAHKFAALECSVRSLFSQTKIHPDLG